MTATTHDTLVCSAPARRAAHASHAAVILLALGAMLVAAAAVTSNGIMQRLLVSIGSDPARDLAWGPTLFRSLLALHGVLLVIGGVLQVRRQRQSHFDAAPVSLTTSAPLPLSTVLTLAGMLLLALALRLWKLDGGLWYDEIITLVRFVRPPVGEILTSFPNQNQHMLYSLLAHGAVALFGEGTWQVRLPAALFGVAGIWALFMLVRHLAGTREALLAAALMTFSYHHVWFSQNARGYSGVLFFATLAAWLWLVALPRTDWRIWLAFALTVALGMWVHMTMAFVAAAMGLSYLILLAHSIRTGATDRLASRWHALAALALSGTLTLQLYALGLPEFLSHGLHEVSLKSEWTNPLWLVTETIKGLHLGFAGSVVLLGGAVVLAAGCWSAFRQNWVVPFIAIVPGVVLCGTMIALKHNLWPRFVFFAAGFGIFFVIHGVMYASKLLVGVGLGRPRLGTTLGTIACLLLVAASASTLRRAYHPKQDYAAARDFVAANAAPGDSAVAVGMAGAAFRLYVAPEWPWVKTQAELDAIRARSSTVWVVYTTPIHMKAWFPELWDDVQRDFTPVKQFPGTLGGGTIYVCRQAAVQAAIVP